jgi:brefeldin A-resistance guanine nucleotide exchange factor 1
MLTAFQNLYMLSLTLRIVFDLFNTVKQHLKVQLEVFFTSLHLRMLESESSTFEQKEMVLESLVEFCNEPSLIVGRLSRWVFCTMS